MAKSLIFRLAFLLAVLLNLSSPCAQCTSPSKYVGWQITQRNRLLGRVELGLCPAGCTFHTSIFNGFVRETGSKIIITMVNTESKTFHDFSYEHFKDRVAKIYKPMKAEPAGWKRVTKQKVPGGKMFGFDTIRYDYNLINTQPPYQSFPDQCWLCPKLTSSPRVMQWFAKLVRTPQEFEKLGLPLKVVETMDTRTNKKFVFHETLKIVATTFEDADFKPPAGYRLADTDMDLFDFGP